MNLLPEDKIAAIRQAYLDGEKYRSILERCNICRPTLIKYIQDLPRRKPSPKAKVEAIREAYMNGETWRDISKRFGVNVSTFIHGLPKRGRKRRLSQEQIADMQKRYLAGESWKSLEARYGVSQAYVWYYVRGLKKRKHYITPEQIAEIRQRYCAGETITQLSRAYGYAICTIFRRVRGLERGKRKIIGRTGAVHGARKRKRLKVAEEKPVIEAYCKVCPTGVMRWEVDWDTPVKTVTLTCPDCGSHFWLYQLVEVNVLNATLARLARTGELGGGTDDSPEAD